MATNDDCEPTKPATAERSSTPGDEVATSTVTIDRPTDEVWAALVEPDGLAVWLGPGTVLDPTPGGTIDTPDIATGVRRRGRVEHVEVGERLALVWWPDDDRALDAEPDSATIVELDLEPTPAGTVVTVTERPLAPAAPTASASVRSAAAAGARSATAWRLALLHLAVALCLAP